MKKNITKINNHFEILDKLNPINFQFKSDTEGKFNDGFIADELYDSYRDCVTGEPNGMNEDGTPDYMRLCLTPLIPILTKCIQGNREKK